MVHYFAVALPYFVVTLVELCKGWEPTQDDANITFRSWLVLSKYPPLLGQYSQVSQGHKNVYDLGPLLYWFLTIPVHLDPRHGMLWGGALLAVAGLVLAVKAAWSFGGERAGSVVTVLILVYLAVYPPAVLDPAWNVNIGITYLIVTGVTGWAVSNGKIRWLPFLVLAASFDCQCHLIFVLPALTIVLVSLGFGLTTWVVRNAGKWSEVYLAAGVSVAVGIAVWLAPILQQTGNDPGNMTLLLRSTSGGNAAKAGFTLGAQTVGSSILPYESWIVHPHPPDFWSVFAVLEAHGTVPSLMALAGLSIVIIAALGQRNLTVATGAALTLCSGLAFVWTFASIPHRSLFSLLYVYQAVWPIGIAATACYLWLAVVLLRKGVTLLGVGLSFRSWPLRHAVTRGSILLAGLAVAASSLWAVWHTSPILGGWSTVGNIQRVAKFVESDLPRGPLLITTKGNGTIEEYGLIYGLAWRLYSDGWAPSLEPDQGVYVGAIEVVNTAHPPPATVFVTYRGDVVDIEIDRSPGRVLKLALARGSGR